MGSPTTSTNVLTSIEIPPISNLHIARLPRRTPNPNGLTAYRRIYKEADRTELVINPKNYYDHVTMSAYLWPHTSVDRLTALVYFNTIGYYINDTIGRDIQTVPEPEAARLRANVARTAEEVLLNGADADQLDKYGQAFVNLRERLVKLSNLDFVSRFFPILMIHWRDATVNYNRTGCYEGGLEEFIALRRTSSGMLPTIVLTELAQDVYMPPRTLDQIPSLGTAIDALADVGGLGNELFSYAKEVIVQGTQFNLVPVIEREYGLDTVSAIIEAMSIVNTAYETFKTALDDSLVEASRIEDAGARAEVERFLASFTNGMWDIAAACYHWQMETNRYRSEHNPFPDLKSQIPYEGILPASQVS